jgi:hypothetical protein
VQWIAVKERDRGAHQVLLSADGERVGLLYSNNYLMRNPGSGFTPALPGCARVTGVMRVRLIFRLKLSCTTYVPAPGDPGTKLHRKDVSHDSTVMNLIFSSSW